MLVLIHIDLSRIIETCDNVGVYRLFQCHVCMAIPANRMSDINVIHLNNEI